MEFGISWSLFVQVFIPNLSYICEALWDRHHYHHHHHHLPPWIRSFDLFRHRRVAIVSWGAHYLFFLKVGSWGRVSEVWCCIPNRFSFFVPLLLSFDPPISKAVRLCLWVLYFHSEGYQPIRKTPILQGPVGLSYSGFFFTACPAWEALPGT